MTFRPWGEAMHDALYGPAGFYVRHLPAGQFRTAVSTGPLFAEAVRELAERVDDALGRPDPFDVVDLGAGGGELLAGLSHVPGRWRLTGVDLNGRWPGQVPSMQGLLFANEWLDNVPVDVLFDGRLVEVSPDGQERLGQPAPGALTDWAARWWPRSRRVEVGQRRDAAWSAAVSRVRRGLIVAADYGHTVANRRTTLTGYRDGRQVAPLPDGSCDLTAHVALDACAAATGARLITQRDALLRLGVSSELPDRKLAETDPRGYLALLQSARGAGELLDPRAMGSFGWLVQAVGMLDPLTDSTS